MNAHLVTGLAVELRPRRYRQSPRHEMAGDKSSFRLRLAACASLFCSKTRQMDDSPAAFSEHRQNSFDFPVGHGNECLPPVCAEASDAELLPSWMGPRRRVVGRSALIAEVHARNRYSAQRSSRS